ncbi:MAG: F0F1 ATP synthase subunit gamma, partial [Nitrospinae bacterium]|nr:F0F1 ATP synthase subunit gamma [Nitrospinota bacterium]
MANLKEIKRRIQSVKSTQQITKAMKMVSAAKLNRAKTAVHAAQPYAEKMRRMVSSLHGGMGGEEHPLFADPGDRPA